MCGGRDSFNCNKPRGCGCWNWVYVPSLGPNGNPFPPVAQFGNLLGLTVPAEAGGSYGQEGLCRNPYRLHHFLDLEAFLTSTHALFTYGLSHYALHVAALEDHQKIQLIQNIAAT